MLPFLLFMACRAPEPPAPAPTPHQVESPRSFSQALGMAVIERTPLAVREGEQVPYPTYSVRPVSLEVFSDFWISGALWLPPSPGPWPGLLVAHGHFGEGKSSGESQAPAHAMAARGWAVLAMDTPGVEEGDVPGRQIHHDGGSSNRALLEAAGTSAMAIQLHGLQAGLDYLSAHHDLDSIAVTGASGGSVQSLYLLKIDPRPMAAVLASPVPMPREPGAGGCTCDVVPDWPVPDPGFLKDLTRPSLWLSELDKPAPPGLPASATWEVIPSPHGFSAPMIQRAADWLDDTMGREPHGPIPDPIPHTPSTSLISPEIGATMLSDVVKNVSN